MHSFDVEIKVSNKQVQECIEGHLEDCELGITPEREVELLWEPLYSYTKEEIKTYKSKSIQTMVSEFLDSGYAFDDTGADMEVCNTLRLELEKSLDLVNKFSEAIK